MRTGSTVVDSGTAGNELWRSTVAEPTAHVALSSEGPRLPGQGSAPQPASRRMRPALRGGRRRRVVAFDGSRADATAHFEKVLDFPSPLCASASHADRRWPSRRSRGLVLDFPSGLQVRNGTSHATGSGWWTTAATSYGARRSRADDSRRTLRRSSTSPQGSPPWHHVARPRPAPAPM